MFGCRIVYVAQTDEEAHREVEPYLRGLLDSYEKSLGPAGAQFSKSGNSATALKYDSMIEDGNIILGSPATVAEGIARFYRRSGGFGTFMLVAGRDFTTPEKIEAMYHLFAESVAPRIAGLDRDLDVTEAGEAQPRVLATA